MEHRTPRTERRGFADRKPEGKELPPEIRAWSRRGEAGPAGRRGPGEDRARELAHEIRNPLAAISCSASLLRSAPGLDDQARRLIEVVLGESRRLHRIVDDLIAHGRPRLRSNCSDPRELVEDVVTLLRRDPRVAGRIAVRVVIAPGLRPVALDPDRIRALLWNVLVNAVEAVGTGGSITVEVAPALRARLPGVRFDVLDDGPGLPRALRQRLHQRFVTSKRGGCGIGLAMAREVAEQHGGSFQLEDWAEGGARARLWIPQDPATPRSDRGASARGR